MPGHALAACLLRRADIAERPPSGRPGRLHLRRPDRKGDFGNTSSLKYYFSKLSTQVNVHIVDAENRSRTIKNVGPGENVSSLLSFVDVATGHPNVYRQVVSFIFPLRSWSNFYYTVRSYCHVTAISLPCCPHAIALLALCRCHVIAMLCYVTFLASST